MTNLSPIQSVPIGFIGASKLKKISRNKIIPALFNLSTMHGTKGDRKRQPVKECERIRQILMVEVKDAEIYYEANSALLKTCLESQGFSSKTNKLGGYWKT